MCNPLILPALQAFGTVATVGGALIQGISGYSAGQRQAAQYAEQRQTEAQLTATTDNRQRAEFRSAMAQQRAELAARGIQMDSVTSVLLGRQAAQEMSFESQATRATGQARDKELSMAEQMARADATNSLLTGTFSAASGLISGAPSIWPGLLSGGAA